MSQDIKFPHHPQLARVTGRALLQQDRMILRWQFGVYEGLTDVRRVMHCNHETCNTDQTCPLVRCSENIMSGHVRFALTAHEQINLMKTHMDARLDLPSSITGSDLPPVQTLWFWLVVPLGTNTWVTHDHLKEKDWPMVRSTSKSSSLSANVQSDHIWPDLFNQVQKVSQDTR